MNVHLVQRVPCSTCLFHARDAAGKRVCTHPDLDRDRDRVHPYFVRADRRKCGELAEWHHPREEPISLGFWHWLTGRRREGTD